jgi:hypothetical protein
MDHYEFTDLLKQIGLTPKKLPRSTLRNWAREGLIPGPEAYSKEGEQGQYRKWPEEAVEEAAAVWALRNLNKDQSRPPAKMVKRVKFEAQRIHEMIKNDVNFIDAIYQRCFDSTGTEGTYMKAYDLDPYIKLWIIAIEKARHEQSIVEPATITFNWIKDLDRQGDNESWEFRYCGVTFEPSDHDEINYHYSSSREVMKKQLGREPTDWAKAKREGKVVSLGKNTDWNNVGFDEENQLIIIKDDQKKEVTVFGPEERLLKEGIQEISDEILLDPQLFKHDKPLIKPPDTEPGKDPEADKAYLKRLDQLFKEREQGARSSKQTTRRQ